MNLAALHERQGRLAETEACLARALEARAADRSALFSLAALLTRQERYREALLLWDRYVALWPDAPDIGQARRSRMLCGLAAPSQPLSAPRFGALPCETD